MKLTTDPVAAKRKRLAELIYAKRAARVTALGSNPMIDHNASQAIDLADRAMIERDVAGLSAESVDFLLEYHSGASAGYVW